MTLLSQKAKEDLEMVTKICNNLQSIIIRKNRNSHLSFDHFVHIEGKNKIYPIPNNTIKLNYKNILYLYFKNTILFISKKVQILFRL